MTSSNGNILCVTSPLWRESNGCRRWRGALVFSMMYARTNGLSNSQGAGDLRRHAAHCDVNIMIRAGFSCFCDNTQVHTNVCNSLAPGRRGSNFESVISEQRLRIKIMSTSCEIALRWMPQNLTDDYSTLVQVMAWCLIQHVHYFDVTWVLMRFKSPAHRLCFHQLVQATDDNK